jgi:hypothetical protein
MVRDRAKVNVHMLLRVLGMQLEFQITGYDVIEHIGRERGVRERTSEYVVTEWKE